MIEKQHKLRAGAEIVTELAEVCIAVCCKTMAICRIYHVFNELYIDSASIPYEASWVGGKHTKF